MSDRHTRHHSIYSLAIFVPVCIIAFWLSDRVTLRLNFGNTQSLPNPTSDLMDQDHLSLLPYDILRQVCASASSNPNSPVPLDGLSKSNKHLRDVSLPELFRNVVIRGRWEFARSRLGALEECHDILPHVKVFKFDVYEGDGAPPPPQSMPSKLAKVLSAMPQLEKLVFVVPEYHGGLFEEAFRQAELVMPSVDVLVVGPYCEFIVAGCPNVSMISTNGWQWLHSDRTREHGRNRDHSMRLIKAAGAASELRHFEMMEWWEIFLLEALLEATPNISSMGMDGGDYRASIEEFLPTLSRFQNLRTLALAGAHSLHIGFDPPRCGNAYRGPRGNEYRQQVISKGKEAEKKVAHMVFPVCANLKELWIGDSTKATVERYSDGGVRNINMSEGDRGKVFKYPRT